MDDPVGLQAHDEEDASFEDELNRAPVLLGSAPVAGRQQTRSAVGDNEPCHYRCHQTGPAQVLGRDGRQEGYGEGDGRVRG